jgi:hypothetical protein
MKIKVKCVCCDFIKILEGEECKKMPMCDKCFFPMIPEEVKS